MPEDSQELPNVSRAQFAKNLAESGLLDAAILLPDSTPSLTPDGAAAARELVNTGHLTPYQADAVLGGRFADLRMGNYEILDRLGAGGMGTVFKARHRRMKRIVALKLLSREVAASEKFLNRFQREIETIARLNHPNVVMAFDADEGEAGPFLVMEFVNGRDLATEVTTNGPLAVTDAVDRILQAARGLEYAHAQGIIHRDIKPGNILRDVTGVVKVADLGLARFRDPGTGSGCGTSLTQAGVVFGTVDYMSPEQAVDSGTVDQRADVYSLGCTLYFLLVGHPPYSGGSLMSIMLKHRDSQIPELRATRPEVPTQLEAIFRRMVAKQPEDRYPSMAGVIKDLEGAPTWGRSVIPTPRVSYDRTVELGALKPGAGLADDFAVGAGGAAAASVVPDSRVAGLTAVIAEPSRTQVGIIRSYLQKLGFAAVHTSASGREAIEVIRRVGANVLISSLHLSDMTGAQLAAALLADPECAQVGFVLATSSADEEAASALPQSPRTVVMIKPFDLERLARSIASVVGFRNQ
jgi:serine/threonine-protein kinase